MKNPIPLATAVILANALAAPLAHAGDTFAFNIALPVASAPGAFGTYFRTDLTLTNPYDWRTQKIRVLFFRTDTQSNNPQFFDVTLAAGESATYTDVLASRFNTTGAGILLVQAQEQLRFLASAKTYTQSTSGPGSYGFGADGMSRFNGPLESAVLTGLRVDDAFRTNVSVASVSPDSSGYVLEVRDAAGALRGQTSFTLPTAGHHQVSLGAIAPGVGAAYAVVRSTTSEFHTWCTYATVIDNASGDSTLMTDRNDGWATKVRSSLVLQGRWEGSAALPNNLGSSLKVNLYQTAARVEMDVFDSPTGAYVLNCIGTEETGTVRMTCSGRTYPCLGAQVQVNAAATASTITGNFLSGSGCLASTTGAISLTKTGPLAKAP